MRRLVSVAACVTLVGCDVGPSSSDPAVSPADLARARFKTDAWTALGRCVPCHGKTPTIDFLAPGTVDDAYTSVFAYQPPVVDLATPGSSLLVTMGQHRGPALLPAEANALLVWLEAERTARVPAAKAPTVIGPLQPQVNAITAIDLGLPGAQLRVIAGQFPALYLSKIELVAGAAGLHVVHPLFVSKPAGGEVVLDDLDRFRDLDLELSPNETVELGAAAFLPFAPDDPLTIYVRTLEAR